MVTVLGFSVSSNRDFHQTLHEELVNVVIYIHPLHPDDVVSSFSYITKVDENLPRELECVSVRTIGVKNSNEWNRHSY